MGRDYRTRLQSHFVAADIVILKDCDTMLAEHSAANRLQSGTTLRRAAEIWLGRTGECTDAALTEFATLIERRGREWNRAMAAVLSAIDERRPLAVPALANTFRAASARGAENGNAMQAVETILDTGVAKIRERTIAFRDGWTSPRPPKWNERHPVLLAILMVALGAGLTEGGRALIERSDNQTLPLSVCLKRHSGSC